MEISYFILKWLDVTLDDDNASNRLYSSSDCHKNGGLCNIALILLIIHLCTVIVILFYSTVDCETSLSLNCLKTLI